MVDVLSVTWRRSNFRFAVTAHVHLSITGLKTNLRTLPDFFIGQEPSRVAREFLICSATSLLCLLRLGPVLRTFEPVLFSGQVLGRQVVGGLGTYVVPIRQVLGKGVELTRISPEINWLFNLLVQYVYGLRSSPRNVLLH